MDLANYTKGGDSKREWGKLCNFDHKDSSSKQEVSLFFIIPDLLCYLNAVKTKVCWPVLGTLGKVEKFINEDVLVLDRMKRGFLKLFRVCLNH